MKILCLGASYSGRYLADHFPEHQVWFLSRRPDEVRADGRQVFEAHAMELSGEAGGPVFDAILDTVPAIADPGAPRESGMTVFDSPYFPVIDRLRARDPGLPLVHVSSTSVFATAGQATGVASDGPAVASCDERTEARPDTDRGRLRLALERRVRERYPDACILRSAGIYGPGRSLALQFRAGNFRRAASGNQYVSRIHVHDLVRLALALIARRRAAPDDFTMRLVHAVDERPTANGEVFAFLESELGVHVPGKWRDEPPRGRMIRSLYAADLLGRAYRYPTYVEGFRACL